MISMPAENKAHEGLNQFLSSQCEDSRRTIKSAEECIAGGDYFQAAVRLEKLGLKFTELEMRYFELMSGEDGPLVTSKKGE